MKIPDKFWNVLQGTAKGTGSAGSKISVATSKGIIGGCYCGGQIVAGQKVFLAKAQNNQWWVFSSVPTTNQVVKNTKQIFKGKAPVTKIVEFISKLPFKTIAYTTSGNDFSIYKSGDAPLSVFTISNIDDLYNLYVVNLGLDINKYKIIATYYDNVDSKYKTLVFLNSTTPVELIAKDENDVYIDRFPYFIGCDLILNDVWYDYKEIVTIDGSVPPSRKIDSSLWWRYSGALKLSGTISGAATLNIDQDYTQQIIFDGALNINGENIALPDSVLTKSGNGVVISNYQYSSNSGGLETYSYSESFSDDVNQHGNFNGSISINVTRSPFVGGVPSGGGTAVSGSGSVSYTVQGTNYYGVNPTSSSFTGLGYLLEYGRVNFPRILLSMILIDSLINGQNTYSDTLNNCIYKTILDNNHIKETFDYSLSINASFTNQSNITETRSCSGNVTRKYNKYSYFLKKNSIDSLLADNGLFYPTINNDLQDNLEFPITTNTESGYFLPFNLIKEDSFSFNFNETVITSFFPVTNIPGYDTGSTITSVYSDWVASLVGQSVVYSNNDYTYYGQITSVTPVSTDLVSDGIQLLGRAITGTKVNSFRINYQFTEKKLEKRALKYAIYTPNNFTFYTYNTNFENGIIFGKHFRLYKNNNDSIVLVYSRFPNGLPYDNDSSFTGQETVEIADIFDFSGNTFVYRQTISSTLIPMPNVDPLSYSSYLAGINYFPF